MCFVFTKSAKPFLSPGMPWIHCTLDKLLHIALHWDDTKNVCVVFSQSQQTLGMPRGYIAHLINFSTLESLDKLLDKLLHIANPWHATDTLHT